MTPWEEAQQSVGQRLLDLVPEYRVFHDQHRAKGPVDFGSHTFLYEFANALSAALTTEPPSSFVDHAMAFLNELGESSSLEQLNLLNVGVLEILYTNGIDVRAKARALLSAKNLATFDAFSTHYL